MSQASAISHPPPRAKPLTAAMVGTVLRSRKAVAAWPSSAKRLASKGLISFIAAISAPATKALSPAPVTIVTRGGSLSSS